MRLVASNRLFAAARIAGVVGVAATLGGCAYGEREQYFASRAAVVEANNGDGSARLAVWPAINGTRAVSATSGRRPVDSPVSPARPAEER